MTTRIEKDFVFQSAVFFENNFLLNIYDLTISMLVETESIREQNIAMERIRYIIEECLENCIIINQDHHSKIEDFQKAGIRICTLPEEPYDQILSLILLLKLNSVMEGKMSVTDLILGSKLSDGVRFNSVKEMAENVFPGKNWWTRNTLEINDLTKFEKKQKIVKLFKEENWDNIGLVWKDRVKHMGKQSKEPDNIS